MAVTLDRRGHFWQENQQFEQPLDSNALMVHLGRNALAGTGLGWTRW